MKTIFVVLLSFILSGCCCYVPEEKYVQVQQERDFYIKKSENQEKWGKLLKETYEKMIQQMNIEITMCRYTKYFFNQEKEK